MKTILTALLAAGIIQLSAPTAKAKPKEETPVVQIALLLDTSSSMSGLIDQARSQLWKVVNEFISAEQNGQTPVVQVALYEYGNDRLKKEANWIRQVQPLTRDLDQISEDLFALSTNGGEEYCGAVIEHASLNLKWDTSADTYKTIFIAGNEPFTQGPIKSEAACKATIEKGIIVNTIHCGNEREGINGKWKSGALLADGSFMTIDQNQVIANVEAPQDKELVKLNQELNGTYVAWGANGAALQKRQIASDEKAFKSQGDAWASRAATKASSNYYNSNWDLVDATEQEKLDITKLKKAELPEAMQKMTTEEQKAYLETKKTERAEIQKKILKLNSDRKKFVAEKLKEGNKKTLDTAMIKAIQKQASKKSISFQ